MTDSKSRIMSQTYRSDVSVRPLSSLNDVCESFKEILRAADARIKICGLENCSFSYDVPDEGLVKISGYLHVDKGSRLYETTVRTWILDERIIGEFEWTLDLPGRRGEWRQQPIIKSIFAACDGGTRRLEDWVGNSSGTVNRGGRPAKASQPAAGRGGGRNRRGQRRGEAARPAAQATAHA